MTTVTALHARLNLDVSNFSEGANLAKAETNRVAAIMRASVPPAEKYKRELDLINRAFSETGKKSKEYANAVAHLDKTHQQAASAIAKTTAATKHATTANNSALTSIKQMAAAYISFQAVTKSINLATQVEDATVAFEVLTGSVNDGKVLFSQVREFSERSPITFSGAAQAVRTMMSFGVAAQDIQKNLQMLSDVTGGNNDRFKMLSLAFSQTSAAGRLMGQDLLQMINAGFNPLQQISKMTGESLLDLKARMEDGGISADEVRRAFEAATAETGMFHGMTERLAETMGGKLNIAFSQLEKSMAAAGQAMAPLIIALTDGMEEGKSVMNGVVWVIEKISDGLRTVIAVLKDFWDMDFKNTAMHKLLDDLDQRDRDRANATANLKFEKEKQAIEAAAAVDKQAIEDAQKAHLKAVKEWEKARLKAIAEAHRAQQKAIEAELRARQAAARAWQRELEAARSEAMKFFEERERQNKKMREDVARGPGSGMEIGSADAVKFAADAVNAAIAKEAVPEDARVRERDIAKKTAELLIAQREANAIHQKQLDRADAMLAEMEQNGFRRIR